MEKLYVVENKNGTLNLCFGKPIRNENDGMWVFENELHKGFVVLDKDDFPQFKNVDWEDEPQEVHLSLMNPLYKFECPKCGHTFKCHGTDIYHETYTAPWSGYEDDVDYVICPHCQEKVDPIYV